MRRSLLRQVHVGTCTCNLLRQPRILLRHLACAPIMPKDTGPTMNMSKTSRRKKDLVQNHGGSAS
jgi:hypothetical protein